ncbi:MAG: hypothetical protein ACTHLT_14760 [Devosia sp.]
MNLAGLPWRAAALAGLTVATLSAATPASAARADVELLQSYLGSWSGSSDIQGRFRGKDGGKVSCKLSLSPGNGDKVNYSGNCTLAGTSMTVKGTLVYNAAGNRYEAAMTSNVSFSGLAIGKRQGKGILFNFKERNKDEDGVGLSVNASILLHPEKIGVDFDVAFDNGDKLSASVPFTK